MKRDTGEKEQRKQYSDELGRDKRDLKEIRTKWENEYIKITTEEIREGEKRETQELSGENKRT